MGSLYDITDVLGKTLKKLASFTLVVCFVLLEL
jgi:hypothetical protein